MHDEFDLHPFRPEQYQCHTISPPKADSQRDGWSCGLFTLMYTRAFISNTSSGVQDSEKFATATSALERLLKLPYVHPPTDTTTTADITYSKLSCCTSENENESQWAGSSGTA